MFEKFDNNFLKKYDDKQPLWGFGGLGYIVMKRSYARRIENRTEEWWEVVRRGVEGAQEIGANYTTEEAERLYDHVFNLRCNFAGRALWQLGTGTIKKLGANSLINCFYTDITKLEDFLFIFENLMLGGGLGYSVRKEHAYEFPKIKEGVIITHQKTNDADFIVPDSREGWIALLDKVLKSYFYSGKSFAYSTILIRGKGEKIKTFGGIAAGPQVLVNGISEICKVLKSREGKKLRSIDVLDVCNLISQIVISGNVRRSAAIALGDVDDSLFLKAKRWDTGKIPNWRAMSNNTVECNNIEDLQPLFWEGYKGNGEPYGLFNLKLAKKYGRTGEEHFDETGNGLNPCISGDTLIWTRDGEVRIDSVVGEEVDVWNGYTWSTVVPQITGYNQKMIRLTLSNEKKIDCTYYHEFNKEGDMYGNYTKAIDLKVGDFLKEYRLPDNTVEKPKIKSIEELPDAEKVFCFNEPEKHQGTFNGIVTRQCGEIVALADKETCNLSELYMNNIPNKETMLDCAKLLYKYQKAVCNMNYIDKETTEIVHKNNRIGVGVTGILQNQKALEENWYDYTYKELRNFDKRWSKERGWNKSIRLTTIKPSGSLSLLAGATPGIHPAYSEYYIRRVEMSSNDPLVKYCKDLGLNVEYRKHFDGTDDRLTVKVEFPCFVGEDTPTSEKLTAVELLEYVKKMQTIWADNAVSVTCYYKKEELPEIKKWLKNNYNDNIKTVSFLLHSDHGFIQAPYEPIAKEKYEELISNVKPITPINQDTTVTDLTSDCDTGSCPIR